MEDVTSNKRKMKELEDSLLYRLTSTQARNRNVSEMFFLEMVNYIATNEKMSYLFARVRLGPSFVHSHFLIKTRNSLQPSFTFSLFLYKR